MTPGATPEEAAIRVAAAGAAVGLLDALEGLEQGLVLLANGLRVLPLQQAGDEVQL